MIGKYGSISTCLVDISGSFQPESIGRMYLLPCFVLPIVMLQTFSSVQLISGRRLRGLPLCPDLRRSMRLIGHMGLSYDRIGRGGLSSACPIVA